MRRGHHRCRYDRSQIRSEAYIMLYIMVVAAVGSVDSLGGSKPDHAFDASRNR